MSNSRIFGSDSYREQEYVRIANDGGAHTAKGHLRPPTGVFNEDEMDILKEWRIAIGSFIAVLFVDCYLQQRFSVDSGVGAFFVYSFAAMPLLSLLGQNRIKKRIATGKLRSFHIYVHYFVVALLSVSCIFQGIRELTAERISVLPIPVAVFIFIVGRIIWLRLSLKRVGK